MKNKLSYKSKRRIIVATAALAVFATSVTGTYMYIKGNNESEGGAIYMVSNDADNTWHNGMPLVNKVLTVASLSASKPILGLIGTIFSFVKWVVPGSDGYTQCISCNFINCNASSKGGAISLEGENYVGDCNFTNNYAPKGSSIFIWADAELEIASSYAYDVPSNVASIFIDDIGELDSNIIITTIDNKTRHVDNGQVVNLNATITTDTGMSVAGGLLTFTVNGKSLDAKSGVDGLYSTNRAGNNYTVDFIGTKPVDAIFDDDYWEGDATVIMGNLTTNRLDVNLVADSVKGTPGEKLNVTIKVTDINNDPVTGGVVTVKFEGNDYLANVTDGVASIVLPSSIISSVQSKLDISVRDILLKYFDFVAVAEFGSATFGKTNTTTVVLFLRRKKSEPELATHYNNRVNAWFSNNHGQDYRYDDTSAIERYTRHIGVPYEAYLTLLEGNPSDELFQNEIFAAYANQFSNDTEAKKIKDKFRRKNQ